MTKNNIENPNNSYNSLVLNNENDSFDSSFNFKSLLDTLLRRKKLYFVSFIFFLTSFIINLGYRRIFKPVYKGSFTLLISDPISTNNESPFKKNYNKFENFAISQSNNDVPTLIQFLQSPAILDPIAKGYNTSSSAISKKLSIKLGGSRYRSANGILIVELLSSDPKKGELILKDLSNSYLEISLKNRQKRLSEGLDFINSQTPALKKKKLQYQNELAEFRAKNAFIFPKLEVESLEIKESTFDNTINSLGVRKNQLINIKNRLIKNLTSPFESNKELKNVMEDNLLKVTTDYQEFENKYLKIDDEQINSLEEELLKAKSIYKPDSKIIKIMEKNIERLKPDLKKSQLKQIEANLNHIENKIKSVKSQKAQLQKQYLIQPELIKKYNEIQIKLEFALKNLLGVNTAKENFQLQLAQNTVPWRIIVDPKFTDSPIEPTIKSGIIYAFILSILFSYFVVFIRDRFDYVFFSAEEAVNELKITNLSEIPYLSFFKDIRNSQTLITEKIENIIKENNLNQSENPNTSYELFAYQESFRNLYTSFKFLNSDNPLKVVGITSSIPAEGKTLINLLLAKTLSEMGLKILLIDADMRKPQIHRRLGLDNFRGLSNLLTDSEIKIKDVTQNVNNFENWDIISSGTIPPDPIRLLSSEKMRIFLEELKLSKKYDLVIIDTPPIIGLSDATLISRYIDGLVLLVSIGKVPKNFPKEVILKLKSLRINLLGILTNSLIYTRSGNKITYSEYGYGLPIKKEKKDLKIAKNKKDMISVKIKNLINIIKTNSNKLMNWLDN